MKQTIFLSIYLIFILYALFLSYKNQEVLANECVNSITPRIVGGEDADMSVHSYTLSLRYRGRYFCGACGIGELDVISAAHCFTNHPQLVAPYLEATVHSGTSSPVELGTMHLIEFVTIHPGFTGTWENAMAHDIVYIRLKERTKLEFDENQQKADLPTEDVVSGMDAILTSWGRIIPNVNAPAEHLQMLRMMTLTFNICQRRHRKILQKEHLCAVNTPGHGCAVGDSGSPLVSDNAVIGILSWFKKDSPASGVPEVFTNVFQERDFIDPLMFRPTRSPSSTGSEDGSPLQWKGKGKREMGGSSSRKKPGWFRKILCTAK